VPGTNRAEATPRRQTPADPPLPTATANPR